MYVSVCHLRCLFFFFFQAEDGIRDHCVTGVQTCALPISLARKCRISPTCWYSRTWPRARRTGPRSSPIPNGRDRKSTRLNSSHTVISYAVFCLKKKKKTTIVTLLEKDRAMLLLLLMSQ